MTPAEILSPDFAQAAKELRDADLPFAFATIVRTVGTTAAKPGAKALLSQDGTIIQGWLGGGCTRGAVRRAAIAALKDGTPQLISVAPEELLVQRGVSEGDDVDGTTFASNGCPSKGTVDIFIEPCLPMAQLVVLGASPVAFALTNLAPQFHWATTSMLTTEATREQVVVIATQGQGDLDALKQALSHKRTYIAFVGSTKKFRALAKKLEAEGCRSAQIDQIKAPAGLNIGAVTPEEIALSILSELVSLRRAAVKSDGG
jgi:xanthine dehydrogenase accessory factor